MNVTSKISVAQEVYYGCHMDHFVEHATHPYRLDYMMDLLVAIVTLQRDSMIAQCCDEPYKHEEQH